MLLERLSYQEDFPLNITIANIEDDPIHYHPDIEFIYVLQGEIQLRNGYYIYNLKEGDIFTNSGNEVHSIKATSSENIVAQIQVSTRELSQYFPNLGSACYRTYSKKPNDKKHQILKDLMLQLLSTYEKKGFNYKSECLYIMIEIIKHLDKHFNLFAFEKGMVVGFDRGNQVAVDRISRICTYIYQNYKNNISLNDLSEMEFLSSFYLSHLIKDFTGMNFREFLSFARVEMSEIPLLESNKKISQVARDVGFSATSYYNKYFTKWFGHSPQEHRAMYTSEVKSDLKPAIMTELAPNNAIAIVKRAQSDYAARHTSRSMVTSLNMDVDVDVDSNPVGRLSREFDLIISCDDYEALGPYIIESIMGLAPTKLLLLKEKGKTTQIKKTQKFLEDAGFTVELTEESVENSPIRTYAYDSIAYPICLIKNIIQSEAESQEPLTVRLRDKELSQAKSGSKSGAKSSAKTSRKKTKAPCRMLQGLPGLLTYNGIKKPSYFAYAMISRAQGDIISQSNHHFVLKSEDKAETVYTIFVYNYNDAIQNICEKETDLAETKSAINGFIDELNLNMSINIPPGLYYLVKSNLTKENNLFAHLSALDFREEDLIPYAGTNLFSGWPTPETYIEDVRNLMNINFSLKGVNFQSATIRHQRNASPKNK